MEPTGAIRANAGNSYNSGNKFVVSQVSFFLNSNTEFTHCLMGFAIKLKLVNMSIKPNF